LYFPGGTKPFYRLEKTVLPVGKNKRNFHTAIILHRVCRALIEKKSPDIENTNAAQAGGGENQVTTGARRRAPREAIIPRRAWSRRNRLKAEGPEVAGNALLNTASFSDWKIHQPKVSCRG